MKRRMSLNEVIQSRNYKAETMVVKTFRFNPFQVNTYVLYDETKEAVIIDPGNTNLSEDEQLKEFIEKEQLKVKYVVNTHPHIDHVAGNRFCREQFQCDILMHEKAAYIYSKSHVYAAVFGIDIDQLPEPNQWLKENDKIVFGHQQMMVLYTPGHADGSISLYDEANQMVFVGDALFAGSIGRTDLPTGSHSLLLQSIKDKIMVLPDDTVVFCGHEISTTIKQEKLYNSFINS